MTYTNLLEMRGPARPAARRSNPPSPPAPRWGTAVAASLVAAILAGRRGVIARAVAALAGLCAARAVAGHDDFAALRGARRAGGARRRDLVEIASEESMITSDPPAWTTGGVA